MKTNEKKEKKSKRKINWQKIVVYAVLISMLLSTIVAGIQVL